MTATEDLRLEHVGVGRMLGIMDVMTERIRAGSHTGAGDLAQVVEFLQVFVDQCHHAKEEQLLFPALRAGSATAHEEVLDVLTAEHAQGRELVAMIAAAADHRSDGGGDLKGAELAQAMAEYTKLLRDHVRREERDCFSVADRELPASVQDTLTEGYDRIERDIVGEGRHEAFHELLDRLSLAYPG